MNTYRILFFSLILSLSKDGIHAIDGKSIAQEVTRIAQKGSVPEAVQYGFNACAGHAAGELLGWTLGAGAAAAGIGAGLGYAGETFMAGRAAEEAGEAGAETGAIAEGSAVGGRLTGAQAGALAGGLAGSTLGLTAGTLVGLNESIKGRASSLDQCYRQVTDAAKVSIDTSLHDGARQGFLWIDNQTGKPLTVKLQWLGWTNTQDFRVKARSAQDVTQYMWALGAGILQRITVVQDDVALVLSYNDIVAINRVIGAQILRDNITGALWTLGLRGLSVL